MSLSPTLWRTCRVLMNPLRLRCLDAVLREPGRCVSAIAKEVHLPVPVASQYLRDLQARGMLAVTRRSRWVFYSAGPDPSVEHADTLLVAIGIARVNREIPIDQVRAVLDGLAHPRRLAILHRLAQVRRSDFDGLRVATGISTPALWRHLDKLERCAWIQHGEAAWRIAGDLPPFARRLLAETGR